LKLDSVPKKRTFFDKEIEHEREEDKGEEGEEEKIESDRD